MRTIYVFRLLAISIIVLVAGLLISPFRAWLVEGHLAVAAVIGILPLGLLLWLFLSLVRPFNTLSTGMDLVAAQDFASRLSPVGQVDADRLVEMFNKMMLRLKTERLSLEEKNHFLHLLIESSPLGIAILDFDNRISETNPAMLRMLGVDDAGQLRGRQFAELVNSNEIARAVASLEIGEEKTFRLSDTDIVRCSLRTFIDSGFPHPFVIVESVTEEIIAAEKAAYGKVIRIISHEVNNTLAGVTSVLQTVADIMRSDGGDADVVTTAESCVDRCRSLGNFISSYSDVVKIPNPALLPVDLASALEALFPFLESMMPPNVAIRCEIEPIAGMVMADTVQIEQAVVNIVKNAVESIGDRPDSTIIISLSQSRNNINLSIADNGPGIVADAQGKLFTPFFSTKPGGRGLGLMFVAEILRRHSATFSLTTAPSNGESPRLTTFSIRIPIAR